jgi:hypothetical protein
MGHFWAPECYFEPFEAKLKTFGQYGVLEIYYQLSLAISFQL